MTINNEHKKLNFLSEREQNQACLNSAEHEKNQGRKVLNVPNLRFKEFQGEWEKCTLGNNVKIQGGYAFKSELFLRKGIPIIRISNLPPNASFVDLDDCTYYKEGNYNSFEVHNGDLLIAMSGATTGKTAIYNRKTLAYLNQRVGLFKSTNRDSLYYPFLYALVSTPVFKRQLSTRLIAGAQPNISSSDIESIRISIPQKNEQEKIAHLMLLLNERITTQNKIIEKLQSLIKGISKQLLMNNQNWRTVRIGELLRIGNGKDYKHLGIGKIPVYGTGGQMLLVNDYLYDGESVCIGRKGTIDTPMFLKGKFWTVDTLFYTYDFKDVLPKFCYYLFLQINWKLYNEGTGVPSLSKSTIENIKVKIPSIKQQHNICSVLDCYEHKTKSEEQILELYLSEKQYLLRQMFI